MCGIVAYIGNKQVAPLLVEGLKRLEYRGYDSAGIAVASDDGIRIGRTVGRVSVLESHVAETGGYDGNLGIAHTRWATHGAPSEANAHPHTGIIENYATLRTYLTEKGHDFTSQTDTEVIAKLIAELYDDDLEAAVQSAMREVTGAYAIAVICDASPHTLVCARKGSPLIVGIAGPSHGYNAANPGDAICGNRTGRTRSSTSLIGGIGKVWFWACGVRRRLMSTHTNRAILKLSASPTSTPNAAPNETTTSYPASPSPPMSCRFRIPISAPDRWPCYSAASPASLKTPSGLSLASTNTLNWKSCRHCASTNRIHGGTYTGQR